MACEIIQNIDPLMFEMKITPEKGNLSLSLEDIAEIKYNINSVFNKRQYKKFIIDMIDIDNVSYDILVILLLAIDKSIQKNVKFYLFNLKTHIYNFIQNFNLDKYAILLSINDTPSKDDYIKYFNIDYSNIGFDINQDNRSYSSVEEQKANVEDTTVSESENNNKEHETVE